MSLKGHVFTIDEAPLSIQKDSAVALAWAQEQTARYTIVATDPTATGEDQAIIAEEMIPRILAQLTPKARRAAGLLLRMPKEDRVLLLSRFDASGALLNPFTLVDTGVPITP